MKTSAILASIFCITAAGFVCKSQSCGNDVKYKLPYKNTYVKEPLTAENIYRTMPLDTVHIGTFAQAREILPQPYWPGHDKEIDMYWRAWEIGIGNLRHPDEGSGFVSTYIDTAYNGNIFMWDSSFILMFARYGDRFFPFQRTLDNFYAKQHPDGFICREIMADGADCFERYDPTSTGPNLMPWCEMVYYHQFGDLDRLHRVFPALCGYYRWLKLNHTWQNGTYWSSGWGTGMDNMPRVSDDYSQIYSHGHMTWLDTNLQQLMTAYQLLEMGFFIERWQEIEDFEDEAVMLKKYIRENLWNDETGFLHDQYADGSLCPTKGIGAFWALQTPDVLDKDRLDRLVAHLNDTTEFRRPNMVPSLSADNAKYKANGRYWQGGVWPGTNYMVMNGLVKNGYRDLAYDIASNHYEQVLDVYRNTGTFWEYYSPEADEPGFMARKEFIGWTGLAPIAELIEFKFGIRGDYPENEIVWDMHLTDEHGLERYPFGPEGMIDFKVQKRRNINEEPKLSVKTNVPFKLKVIYGDNKEKVVNVIPQQVNY
ncbi:MAG: hypothetical protein NC082_02060 [Clostridiales bacterium]|nr:hypothetical protein [Clostridiales bacterium]